MIHLDGTIQSSFISFDLYEIVKWFTKCISETKIFHEVKHVYELF